jgi:hypothetical protein
MKQKMGNNDGRYSQTAAAAYRGFDEFIAVTVFYPPV